MDTNNEKKVIKEYNKSIRLEKSKLLLDNSIAALAGIGALLSITTLLQLKPDDYVNDEFYNAIYSFLLASGGAEIFCSLSIPIAKRKEHKQIRQKIADLEIIKSFLQEKYHTCVCNEEIQVLTRK